LLAAASLRINGGDVVGARETLTYPEGQTLNPEHRRLEL
jgi:hypothetical protein